MDGLYLCPLDRGRTIYELDRANAMAAERHRPRFEQGEDRVRGGTEFPVETNWAGVYPTNTSIAAGACSGWWEVGKSTIADGAHGVASITDLSGQGNTLEAKGAGRIQVVSDFNGDYEALQFKAREGYFENSYSAPAVCTYLALLQPDDFEPQIDGHIFDSTVGAPRQTVHWYGQDGGNHTGATLTGELVLYTSGGTGTQQTGMTVTQGQPAAIAFVFNGTSSRVDLDGVTSGALEAGSSGSSGLRVGADTGPTQGFYARVRALAIVEKALAKEAVNAVLNGFLARAGLDPLETYDG